MNTIKWVLVLAATIVLAGCVGYGYPLGGAYPTDGGYYGQGRPDYGDGGYYGGGTVRCESNDGRTRRCNVDTRGGVRLSRQLSDTRCVQGRNWGYDSNGIWVSGGCRAEFVVGAGGGYPGTGGGYGQVVRCESNDGRSRRCNVDTRGGVRLSRQLSDTRCVQGRNWGYDRSGIWVSGGCRGEFMLGSGGGGYYPGTGGGYGQTIRCESRDNRRNRCSVAVRGGVQLVRRLSDSGCDQGRDWGWDRSGIWVDNGCRAEFRVY
jgi:hypothetical protein